MEAPAHHQGRKGRYGVGDLCKRFVETQKAPLSELATLGEPVNLLLIPLQ